MTTLIPAISARATSTASAVSRFLIAASLLAGTACSGAGVEETALPEHPDGAVVHDDDVGAAVSDPEGTSTAQQPLFGSDACKSVDIRVLNSLSYTITVRSLEYYNASEGRWQTEDLANRDVSPGAMEFWTPNFENSENDWLYSFNVIYDHPGHNGHVYHVNTPDQTCIPGRVFLLEIQ
jgi:hypothetical protein